VRHGFTDPGSDERGMAFLGYNTSADRQSWAAMLSFFDEAGSGAPGDARQQSPSSLR
jgi:dienelactone hydrolase